MIDPTASVKDVIMAEGAKIWKYAVVVNSELKNNAIIGDFSRIQSCILGNNVNIQRYALMYNTQMGDYTYVGRDFTSWYCKIGKYCSISWNVSIGGANHDYKRVTSHAFLYAPQFGMLDENQKAGYDRFDNVCEIGNDVWIGANASVLRNVKIGDGAIVAAGAVVTKDVEPYTVVAGIPAKPIKNRFDDETICRLLKIKWWDFPENVIQDNFKLLNSKIDNDVLEKLEDIQKSVKNK